MLRNKLKGLTKEIKYIESSRMQSEMIMSEHSKSSTGVKHTKN
jgi:hypothetical protein